MRACNTEGCPRKHHSKGLCMTCRYREDPVFREVRKADAAKGGKKWRETHPEEAKARTRLATEKHKEKKAVQVSRYQRENKEAVNANTQRRRARLAGAAGTHTAAEWLQVRAAYGDCCSFCGNTERLCKDHIVPLAVGGSNSADNLRPLCRGCNARKSKRLDENLEWLPVMLILKLARWAARNSSM